MVMAYRVEYPEYKVEYDEGKGVVTGFEGNDDGYGINISFVLPDHSTYFASERKGEQLVDLRLVTFELDDDLWDAIQWRASNKGSKSDLKAKWLDMVENLKKPSWSDGAGLVKFIKQTALAFNDDWLPVLKKGIKGKASVLYYEDMEDGLKDTDYVYAYFDGEENAGAVIEMQQVAKQGYDTYITVGKARRLGYISQREFEKI